MTAIQKTGGKSFFEKPEGKTGMIITAAAAAVGGFFVLKYLADVMGFVERIMESTLHTALAGGALFILSTPFWHPQVKLLVGYGVRSFLRMITEWFITIDPIGIMKNYLEDRRKDQAKLKQQIGVVEGVKSGLVTAIQENSAEAKQEFKIAGQAQKTGKRGALAVASRQHGRLEEANVEYGHLLKMVDMHLVQLYKWDEICGVTVDDLENTIRVQTKKRSLIQASWKALNAAKRILKHNEATAMLEQTMEHLKNDFDAKFGEIEQFRKDSASIFESFDLENGIMEEDMLKKLADADKRADELLLGPVMSRRLTADNGDIQDAEFSEITSGKGATNEVDELFARKK